MRRKSWVVRGGAGEGGAAGEPGRGGGARPRVAGEVGGKAANLARLAAAGWPVPPWIVVPADAFRRALAATGLDERVAARLERAAADAAAGGDAAEPTWAAAGAEIRGWIESLDLPAELVSDLAQQAAPLAEGGGLLAVRSSALGEDSATESFAGLHDSFLYRRPEHLPEAVRAVWASAYSDRALAYRRRRGLPLDGIAVAVVVQRMADAEVSGVLFTADPVFTAGPARGDVHRMVLSALWGAGEGLVSAGLDADSWTIDKDGLALTARLADKSERLVFDAAAGRGLRREPVPHDLVAVPCLSDEQVREAARAGLAVERLFGSPQDVELCFDAGGRLWLLQSRPVTTVDELGPAAGHRVVWDNSNIIESYSGVTSPMTFSFIRRAYAIVYHCFAEVMGVDPAEVRRSRPVFESMLGLFRGQVYYNLRNWYRLVQLFPGYRLNKRFMESMMGVRESWEEDAGTGGTGGEAAAPSTGSGGAREWLRVLRLAGRMGWRFLRLRTIVRRFEAHFRERYERWRRLPFAEMAPHEHLALYRRMEEELLWEWKAPIVNDFYVMVFYGTLKRLCASWCGDESGSLQNDLLCGEGGIESTEPTRMLIRMAAAVRRDPELAQRVRETEPEELARVVPADPAFAGLAAEVERYLDLYGFRGMHELKLEEPSVRERPAFLYQVLRNYVAAKDPAALDLEAAEERERRVRREAERRAMAALGGIGGLWRRPVFRRVLANARLGVRNRENLRFARTRIYGVLRELLLAVGDRFAREGLLDRRDDVFHLALEEVWDYVKGSAVTTDLRGLVELRRREFDSYRTEADRMPADRFVTYGLPYHRNLFRARPAAGAEAGGDGDLRGTPCCPGVVRGPVKVVREPGDDVRLDGEILVAGRTDPGWVPLYPSVSGLLIERGSILSHSAIVAREMGLPTIVGVPGLLAALATGQEVEMDGGAGTVRRLEAPEAGGASET